MSSNIINPYKIEKELYNMISDVKIYNNYINYYKQYNIKGDIISFNEFKNLMINKYNYLYNSEALFNKCLGNEFINEKNLEKIDEMLMNLKNIYNGKKKKEDVDKDLGAKYAKEYIDPLIKKNNN